MMQKTKIVLAAAGAILLGACQQDPTTAKLSTSLNSAFNVAVAGFGATENSYDVGSSDSAGWHPRRRDHGSSGDGGMMGGGLQDLFFGGGFGGFGDFGGGRRMFHDDHDRDGDEGGAQASCTYDASSGRFTCPAITRHGLTITRSYALTDVSGNAQSAWDSTTNGINTRITVAGTVTRTRERDDDSTSMTTTLNHASDRTVTGLAKGSTQRTVNGMSAGTEHSTGTNTQGSFTLDRVMGDTITGVTIPLRTSHPPFPTAGSIVRFMSVTLVNSSGTQVSTRREVVTYNGSDTAAVTITKNGTTKNCKLPLPHGRLICQ